MTPEPTPDFPSNLLITEDGTISGEAGAYSIEVRLKPFVYEEEDVNQTLK